MEKGTKRVKKQVLKGDGRGQCKNVVQEEMQKGSKMRDAKGGMGEMSAEGDAKGKARGGIEKEMQKGNKRRGVKGVQKEACKNWVQKGLQKRSAKRDCKKGDYYPIIINGIIKGSAKIGAKT